MNESEPVSNILKSGCNGHGLDLPRHEHELSGYPPTLDDLWAAEWVQAYDAAWLDQDWDRLTRYLAPDVVFRPAAHRPTLIGRVAVVGSIREFMKRARVLEYNATDLKGLSWGTVGVIRYRWRLEWRVAAEQRVSNGRDLLVLSAANDAWQLRARIRS